MEEKLEDFEAVKISIASPEKILSWSYGEVTKPETINYRTQKPERDGLFCERIFGPTKDWECYCGKYKRIRYKGIICEKCGVEVTRALVRRERMGHIKLACPVAHIWYLRGSPSRLGLMLDLSIKDLERIVYFGGYVITEINKSLKEKLLKKIENEVGQKKKELRQTYKKKMATFKKEESFPQAKELQKEEENLQATKNKAILEITSLEKNQIISEIKYRSLISKYGEFFKADIGAEAIHKLLKEINLEELARELTAEIGRSSGPKKRRLQKRLRLIESFRRIGMRPEWMILTILPVIPPDLRPMVQLDGGRFATSDLNDLYRRVINRNNRLKKLMSLGAPEVICRNEKRMLQEAVDALVDNEARRGKAVTTQAGRRLKSLSDILRGKQGRFRQNLLGKRVDYSGRSVIVVGPELNLNECGLPKKIALELFKPFIIGRLIKEGYTHNVKSASRIIEQGRSEVWDILEKIIQEYFILLNRAPTLHRLGIQAFKPVLIEGSAIQIHPLVCVPFNADFDGDQMACHLPLSVKAQEEAKEIMFSTKNILKPADGSPVVSPSQDMVLGCYYLTNLREKLLGEGAIFRDKKEAIMAYELGKIHLQAKIKVKMDPRGDPRGDEEVIETTVGRVLFNDILPKEMGFRNQLMRKDDLKELILECFTNYGLQPTIDLLDKIKNIGFEIATRSGFTIALDDLQIPSPKRTILDRSNKEIDEIRKQHKRGLITERERSTRSIEVWIAARDEIEKSLKEELNKYGSIYSMIDSGARGSLSQVNQLSGMKGLVVNPVGDIIELPIQSNFREGFSVLEYFISMHGARKGKSDTALRTSDSGYLTRRLVDVAQDVVISSEDCGDSEGVKFFKNESDESFKNRIFGRLTSKAVISKKGDKIAPAGILIDEKLASEIEKKCDQVSLRTPLSCKNYRGLCQKCYGLDLATGNLVKLGEAVGIMAAQSIGEPGTQLTMRTFHAGGIAGEDITHGLPRVEELFEIRAPKGEALIAEIGGRVEIKEKKDKRVIRIQGKKAQKEYFLSPQTSLIVKDKDEVEAGDPLTEGHINLQVLLRVKGSEAVQKYIISEIQEIYSSQGQTIHDKHLEVIVRQMFSKVRIKEPGQSDFIVGEVIDKTLFYETNEKLKKEKKKLAAGEELLFGITKAALLTSSFLSAASFQETTRVLVEAATTGATDELHGLKENVIIGGLIPAGTGFRKGLEERIAT